jgi:hypothetical protein
MTHRGKPVDLTKIKRVGLLTIEGEHDDISGVGQTEATHKLCTGIPDTMKAHYLQPGVGHYGVFNGSRFRSEIQPRISDFMLTHNGSGKRAALGHPVPCSHKIFLRWVPAFAGTSGYTLRDSTRASSCPFARSCSAGRPIHN